MSAPSTYPIRSPFDTEDIEACALDFFASFIPSDGEPRGGLVSASDINTGNGTGFPFRVNKQAWLQYLREVKTMSWSYNYEWYDEDFERTERCSESGTASLVPLWGNDASRVPEQPSIPGRRGAILGIFNRGLSLNKDPQKNWITIKDAITLKDSDGNQLSTRDLEIEFVIFDDKTGGDSLTGKNVAHDPATGDYFPQFYLRVDGIASRKSVFFDEPAVAGTATVEDLGTCNLYDPTRTGGSFSATIATRFTDP